MILGTTNSRSTWCAELSLINSAMRLEDFNQVTLPIEITIQHTNHNPNFGVLFVSFIVGLLPLVAVLAV